MNKKEEDKSLPGFFQELGEEGRLYAVEGTVNQILSGLSETEDSLKEINDLARRLLELIMNKALALGEVDFDQCINARQNRAHRDFRFKDVDIATICMDIKYKQENDKWPEMFFCPLHGGVEFLTHVLLCEYCYYFIAFDLQCNSDFDDLFDGPAEEILQELKQWGIEYREPDGQDKQQGENPIHKLLKIPFKQ